MCHFLVAVRASSLAIWSLATLVVALLCVLVFYALRRKRAKKTERLPALREPLAATPALAPPAESRFVDFEPVAACHPSSWELEDQPADWRAAMSAIGARLSRAGVAEILFVHGTMTGHDPLAMGAIVKRALPVLHPRVERLVGRMTKASSNRLLGDLGNYSPEYVRLFETALASAIGCSLFVWSSANHHAARVRATAWLVQKLAASEKATRPGQRVLLVGHSHAGQLFALLTQLLAGGTLAELLLTAAVECGENERDLRTALARIRELEFDFVTLGTAPRYPWGDTRGYRAAHFVNHHSDRLPRRPLRGILNSARSDFVRKLGAAGSDFPAWTEAERRINMRLDAALGPGSDLRKWIRGVRSPHALMPTGTTLLIRYRSVSAGAAPKIVDASFGHGVYTRKGAMLFTAKLIADHFYPVAVRHDPFRLLSWSKERVDRLF
jgi:hypothetical protein